jgi:hypothetical protein
MIPSPKEQESALFGREDWEETMSIPFRFLTMDYLLVEHQFDVQGLGTDDLDLAQTLC